MPANGRKITYAASNLLSYHNAAVVCIMEMCSALEKITGQTTLCVPSCHSSKEELFNYYGVEFPFELLEIPLPQICYTGKLPGRAVLYSLLAANKLAGKETGIIYSREPWLIFILSVVFKRPCIYESHQFRFKGRLQTTLYRSMVRRSVATGLVKLVCISNVLKDYWLKDGTPADKLFVLHDAVNINKYLTTVTREQAREMLAIDGSRPMIVYTGSLLPGKGVDVLLRCANRLAGCSFVIVGGEQDQIEKLKPMVRGDNVRFTGKVPPAQVPLFQVAADVLALPNTRGSVIDDVTSPVKLFEYFAAGHPVVATDIPSLLEVLRHNHNALISAAGDDCAMAEHIEFLIANPDIGKALAANAKQELENHTWEQRAEQILNLCTPI